MVRASSVDSPAPARSSSGGDEVTVTRVDGPYRSSSLRPGAGWKATVSVTGPAASSVTGRTTWWAAPATTSAVGTGRTRRCAADSTTTRSSPTSTAPDGSASPRARVETVSVEGSYRRTAPLYVSSTAT